MREPALLPLSAAALAAALALGGCAPPPEAEYPLSESARAAEPPRLAPTALFTGPLAEGAAAVERIEPERDALAARAAALREHGAALSGAAVIAEPDRARLEAAAAADSPAP